MLNIYAKAADLLATVKAEGADKNKAFAIALERAIEAADDAREARDYHIELVVSVKIAGQKDLIDTAIQGSNTAHDAWGDTLKELEAIVNSFADGYPDLAKIVPYDYYRPDTFKISQFWRERYARLAKNLCGVKYSDDDVCTVAWYVDHIVITIDKPTV